MIEYSKYTSDIRPRIRELTWLNGRLFIILAACIVPISAYFFLVGVLGNATESVMIGWQTITVATVMLAVYVILYFKFKKAVTLNFYKFEQDGKVDYAVERLDENTLEFTRLADEDTFQVERSEVKSVKCLKTIIVMTLKSGRIIDMPLREDIIEIIWLTK